MIPNVVIFLGSFLAFLIQPLVGNTLLPIFGGASSVWSACLATFQTLLVAGYFYAHLSSRALRRGKSFAWMHVFALVLVSLWLWNVSRDPSLYAPIDLDSVKTPPIMTDGRHSMLPYLTLGGFFTEGR